MARADMQALQGTVPAESLTEFFDTNFTPISESDARQRPCLAQAMPLVVDLRMLAEFKRHMAREGWPVQVARMIFDRVYAHERLAFAHTSANEALQGLALELFRRMHATDGLTH